MIGAEKKGTDLSNILPINVDVAGARYFDSFPPFNSAIASPCQPRPESVSLKINKSACKTMEQRLKGIETEPQRSATVLTVRSLVSTTSIAM